MSLLMRPLAWPRTVFGRLVAILFAGLVAAQAFTVVLVFTERGQVMRGMMVSYLAADVARRFGPDQRGGIRINAVAPGFIETAMTDAMTDLAKDALKKSIPMRRIGKAEDVAIMVSFLCSDGAGYVTGQVFVVDGGMAM